MGFFQRVFARTPIVRQDPVPAGKTGSRAFRAPRDKTSMGGWIPTGGTGNERAPSALPLIRSRARDLAQNNPHAMRAVSVLTSHAIGTGLRASVRGDDAFETAFQDWAGSTGCDHEGRLDWYGIQSLATRTMIEAGDSLIVMRDKRTPDGLRLTLQVVDAEQLDASATPAVKGNTVHQGVEVFPSGQVAGYHIRLSLDSDASTYIFRNDVVHMIELLYAGQMRGMPRGAQALLHAKNADEFTQLTMSQARAACCVTAFVTSDRADSPALIGEEVEDDGGILLPEALEPGAVVPLAPGEDVRFSQPPSANGMSDYISISLHAVAVAYGVLSYHVTGDLSGFSYSSGKFGLSEFYRSIDTLRAHTIHPAMRKIIERYRLTYEANTGRTVTAAVTLIAPRRESLEPLKDAQATALRIQTGTLAWSDAVRAEGVDVEDHIAELVAVRDRFKAAGLQFSISKGPVTITEIDDEEGDDGADEEDAAIVDGEDA